jgi:outer membrane autotransporter protein
MKTQAQWLAAMAGVAGMTLGSGSAWAHSQPGSEKAATPEVTRAVGGVIANIIGGRTGGGASGLGGPQVGQVNRLGSGQSGRSGALGMQDAAVWANLGYSSIENDNVATAFDGSVWAGLVGVDARFGAITVGIAGGYESTDIDTNFDRVAGKLEWDGWSVGPYAVLRLGPNYSIDGSLMYSSLTMDTRAGNGATGSFDATRWLGMANLNGNWSINNWRLGASVGYLGLHQDEDAYTASNGTAVAGNDFSIHQARIGGRVGYNMGKVETYFLARYEYDFDSPGRPVGFPTASDDDDGFVLGIGARFNLSPNVTGGVEATTTQGRDDLEVWGITGTIRFRF